MRGLHGGHGVGEYWFQYAAGGGSHAVTGGCGVYRGLGADKSLCGWWGVGGLRECLESNGGRTCGHWMGVAGVDAVVLVTFGVVAAVQGIVVHCFTESGRGGVVSGELERW